MKKLICILIVLVLALSVPRVALASEVSYPTGDDYRFEINPDEPLWISIWGYNWDNGGSLDNGKVGQHYSRSFNSKGYRARVGFYLGSYLDKYQALLASATKAWFSVKLDMTITSNVSGNGTIRGYYSYNGTDYDATNTTYSGSSSGEALFSPVDLKTLLSDWEQGDRFNPKYDFTLPLASATDVSVDIVVNNVVFIFYLQGIDGQDAEQFIIISSGLADIKSAVDEVKKEVKVIQGQLDNIDNSINQGFDSMGGKLDGVQDSINQGFNGVLTPGADDKDAANDFKDQVDSNKQEASDIKDQLDSVNKPDADELRDQVNPDQFIDKDDESVVEMNAVIASVFDLKILGKYIMVLLGLGLVSLVFFGKKEG